MGTTLQEGPQSSEGWWWDDDSCWTERSTACFAGSGAAGCYCYSRQQALVEQRVGPCPAAVISFKQTNMIEPRATLQWRPSHSLLLLVRNPNPSIHRRDSRSIYILRGTAVVACWMSWVRGRKRVLQTCHGAALVGQPSANPREGRENGSQTLLWWLFGGLGGWSAPRCNLCSQAGTRQEQRPACAGQGPRLPRFLASPGTVSSTTHPQLSCIVITGWNWSTLHNTGRTDGWFVVAENGMGLPVCSM